MTNHINRAGFRFCNRCDQEFVLTAEFFPRDKNRLHGLGYQCRTCENEHRRLRGDPRKNRFKNMPREEQLRRYKKARVYNNGPGRALRMVIAYKAIDKKKGHSCDLEKDWFRENIQTKPCFYCGTLGRNGCDRINNDIGHMKDNVLPCCWTCNGVRGNRFTTTEMKLIGETIRIIKNKRNFAEIPFGPDDPEH